MVKCKALKVGDKVVIVSLLRGFLAMLLYHMKNIYEYRSNKINYIRKEKIKKYSTSKLSYIKLNLN